MLENTDCVEAEKISEKIRAAIENLE